MFFKKNKEKKISFDREKQRAVIRCSICTGEQVAGFKDIATGHFTDVMLIKNDTDIELFKRTYNIDKVTKEY